MTRFGWLVIHALLVAAAIAVAALGVRRSPATLRQVQGSPEGAEASWQIVGTLLDVTDSGGSWQLAGARAVGPLVLSFEGDTLRVTDPALGSEVRLAPGADARESMLALSVHEQGPNLALVTWRLNSWTDGHNRLRPSSVTSLVREPSVTMVARTLRSRASCVFAAAALIIWLLSWVTVRRAAPWFRRDGLATWREGVAARGQIVDDLAADPLPAADAPDGPVLYRHLSARAGTGPYRSRVSLEWRVGARARVSAFYWRWLYASLAMLGAATVFTVAAATTLDVEPFAVVLRESAWQGAGEQLVERFAARAAPNTKLPLQIQAPLPGCYGESTADFFEELAFEQANNGFFKVVLRETLVNDGEQPCDVPSPDIKVDTIARGSHGPTTVPPHQTIILSTHAYSPFGARTLVLRPDTPIAVVVDLWTGTAKLAPGQKRATTALPPVVLEAVEPSPSSRGRATRLRLEHRFPAVAAIAHFGEAFHQVDDLVLEEAVVLREADASRPLWLLLDMTFLRGAPLKTTDVKSTWSEPFVRVVGGDSRTGHGGIPGKMYGGGVRPGARAVNYWPLAPGTASVRLAFGDPSRPSDVIDLELTEGIITPRQASLERTARERVEIDLAREWQHHTHDDLYAARRFVRSAGWDEQSYLWSERRDPFGLLCEMRAEHRLFDPEKLINEPLRDLLSRRCPAGTTR